MPAAFSPQKWTERKGHWSNLSKVGQASMERVFSCHLEPRVSLGLGKSSVDRVPDGEVSTSIRLPRGT